MSNNYKENENLLSNLEKVHTTEMGIERIKRNLGLDIEDAILWCKDKIRDKNSSIFKKGKNWYIDIDNFEITVNAYSYTIITVHKVESKK